MSKPSPRKGAWKLNCSNEMDDICFIFDQTKLTTVGHAAFWSPCREANFDLLSILPTSETLKSYCLVNLVKMRIKWASNPDFYWPQNLLNRRGKNGLWVIVCI